MHTITRLIAAWMLPGLLIAFTARAQHDNSGSPERHLVTRVITDQGKQTATIEIRVLYRSCLSLSLQNEQDNSVLRITLNKQLDAGTHTFTISTERLRPGDYVLRVQDGSDVKTQRLTLR